MPGSTRKNTKDRGTWLISSRASAPSSRRCARACPWLEQGFVVVFLRHPRPTHPHVAAVGKVRRVACGDAWGSVAAAPACGHGATEAARDIWSGQIGHFSSSRTSTRWQASSTYRSRSWNIPGLHAGSPLPLAGVACRVRIVVFLRVRAEDQLAFDVVLTMRRASVILSMEDPATRPTSPVPSWRAAWARCGASCPDFHRRRRCDRGTDRRRAFRDFSASVEGGKSPLAAHRNHEETRLRQRVQRKHSSVARIRRTLLHVAIGVGAGEDARGGARSRRAYASCAATRFRRGHRPGSTRSRNEPAHGKQVPCEQPPG